jgi:hypothetical protein
MKETGNEPICIDCQREFTISHLINMVIEPEKTVDITRMAIDLHCLSHIDIVKLFIAIKLENGTIRKKKLNELLASEEFFDAMQAHRGAPMTDQKIVVDNFEAIKDLIRKAI